MKKVSRSLVDWILREGRLASSPTAFLDGVCGRLVKIGVPLERMLFSLRAIHPQIRATGLVWRRDQATTEMHRAHDIATSDAYLNSPVKRIHDGAEFIRARLVGPAAAHDFPFYDELRQEGMTDYAAFAVRFVDGTRNALSIATRARRGFSAASIAAVRELIPLVAVVLEVHANRRAAEALLDTYVGREAGRQVLRGVVQRGHGEGIRAVIWFADLRGFSTLSDLLPTGEVIAILNEFFDGIGTPIDRHGGQILKFIGDGLLAIFPLGDAAFDHYVCRQALEAALEAHQAIAARNAERMARGEPVLRFNIGLHIGDIVYGNIGTASRLDFTAIGPAVNLAARLETLAAQLNVPIAMSEAFADIVKQTRPIASLGRHALKGLLAMPEVFTLVELAPAVGAAAD